MKNVMRSCLRILGYEIKRISPPRHIGPDMKAVGTVKESQFYTQWQSPNPLYTPWVGHPDFQAIHHGIADHTLVSPDRCYNLIEFARHASHLPGSFAECGVYRGGTALLLARVLKGKARRLHLFDSFTGLPRANVEHDNYFKQGDLADTSLTRVMTLLNEFSELIHVHQGWIPETFQGFGEEPFAFVHVDVDLYHSALDCCRFFYPRMVAGGILLFDDYGFPACRGEKDAVDEFFNDKPERAITLQSGQGLVIKLPSAG